MTRTHFLQSLAAGGLIMSTGMPLIPAVPRRSPAPIHLFSKHLQFLDYPKMAKVVRELGFDGVDLTVRRGGHVDPKQVAEQLPRAAEAIHKVGLRLDMMTSKITDPDDPQTEMVLKAAAEAGVTYYRMGSLRYQENQPIPDQIKKMREKMKRLAEMNRHYGIKGAYQNHSGVRVGAPIWDLHLLLAELEPEYLGVQYDIRHATVEGGNAWPLGLQLIHPLIHTLDIKDFVWTKDEGGWNIQNVPLGEGMVNWDAYFAQLKTYGMQAPMSIHYEYDLGGAEHGDRSLSISQEALFAAMRKDLHWLKEQLW